MKNILKKFEKDDTQYFIAKSFLYPIFESDRRKNEYHIYFMKQNSNPDAYHKGYMNLKHRKMNRLEREHFKENFDKYDKVLQNDDGSIYNLKTKPYDVSITPRFKQYVLSL